MTPRCGRVTLELADEGEGVADGCETFLSERSPCRIHA